MELFKIANGPWERFFTGTFQAHEVELYTNPDKIILVIIYEKKLDRVEGAIVELYKAFSAEGDVESFTQSLPREALVITKHDGTSTMKFLLLESKPAYVRWTEEEFIREVDSLVKRLETSSLLIKDVSKAYELSLLEIGESPDEVKKSFFAMPMLTPLLATSYHEQAMGVEPNTKRQVGMKGEIVLGITRDRQRVVEPLELFMKTTVMEGEKQDRARMMLVIGESALLSNTPAIFFDFTKTFSGIGEANRSTQELQKYMVEIDPIGFPLKSFKPRESLRIDLSTMKPEHLAEAFGIGEKEFPRILKRLLDLGKATSLEELMERTSRMSPTEDFSEFEILKTGRILKLISLRYPYLFGSENDIEEMARQGTSNIARASLLEFENVDDRSTALICHSLLREILEYYRAKGLAQGVRVMLMISSIRPLLQRERQKLAAGEMISMLREFSKYGIGFVIAADHASDIEPALGDQSEAEISIVGANDVSVQLRNRKAYRVFVRPTLSRQ